MPKDGEQLPNWQSLSSVHAELGSFEHRKFCTRPHAPVPAVVVNVSVDGSAAQQSQTGQESGGGASRPWNRLPSLPSRPLKSSNCVQETIVPTVSTVLTRPSSVPTVRS
jgi:hypothetical protein